MRRLFQKFACMCLGHTWAVTTCGPDFTQICIRCRKQDRKRAIDAEREFLKSLKS
jgi:hypothetical protein